MWDDWGGFYDPVPAPNGIHSPAPSGNSVDPYQWGFRVPILVVSGYIKQYGLVDNTGPIISNPPFGPVQIRSQASILRFIEDVYNLPSLNAADSDADDLFGMFDFSGHATPMPFVAIPPGPQPSPTFPANCPLKKDADDNA